MPDRTYTVVQIPNVDEIAAFPINYWLGSGWMSSGRGGRGRGHGDRPGLHPDAQRALFVFARSIFDRLMVCGSLLLYCKQGANRSAAAAAAVICYASGMDPWQAVLGIGFTRHNSGARWVNLTTFLSPWIVLPLLFLMLRLDTVPNTIFPCIPEFPISGHESLLLPACPWS